METPFIDLHIHPATKPFGKSFKRNSGMNDPNKNRQNSIWYYDPPTVFDKILNITASLTKFRQSDFTSLAKGGAQIMFVSLGGIEKGFVMTKLGNKLPGDVLSNLVIGVGKDRIDHIQGMSDYFSDLMMEYNFYKQLDGQQVKVDGRWHQYKIVSNFNEMDDNQELPLKTIYVILTIEGANVFNCGLQMMGRKVNPEEILMNIDRVKKWDKRLFFIGLAHHFDNELVGHAKSLSGVVSSLCDQSAGQDEGFNDLGWKVLRKLIDNTDGKRVLIDLKHLSVKARNEYYRFLEEEYPNETIPLLVSHGAVTGLRSHNEWVEDDFLNSGKFQQMDINFYDDEIIRIAQSGGLFGIQFDERRLGNMLEVRNSGLKINRREILFHKSKLVWRQIQHIAEVLDRNDQFAWEIQCIGTDNDGMVNPLNGYWTSEEMPLLDSYMEKHAFNFINSEHAAGFNAFNKLSANNIVERFMRGNAYEFLKRYF